MSTLLLPKCITSIIISESRQLHKSKIDERLSLRFDAMSGYETQKICILQQSSKRRGCVLYLNYVIWNFCAFTIRKSLLYMRNNAIFATNGVHYSMKIGKDQRNWGKRVRNKYKTLRYCFHGKKNQSGDSSTRFLTITYETTTQPFSKQRYLEHADKNYPANFLK